VPHPPDPGPSTSFCSTLSVPENAAAQYAVASALSRCGSDSNFDCICLYLDRLPTASRVLAVRRFTLRVPAIRTTTGYARWAVGHHHSFAKYITSDEPVMANYVPHWDRTWHPTIQDVPPERR